MLNLANLPKVEILDAWNLLEDEIGELAKKFEVISYRSVKRNGRDRIWRPVKVLTPKSLLAAICTEDTLRFIRRNLRKNTGILVNSEEVCIDIRKLLSEAAAAAMSSIKVPKPAERAKKRKTRKDQTECAK